MSYNDDSTSATMAALQEEALRHFGRRFFAEVQSRSAIEDAEIAAWNEQRSWWQRFLGRPGSREREREPSGSDLDSR